MSIFDEVARAVLREGADAIIAADRNGSITFWNAGAERLFGYPAAVAIGQSLDIIIPERQRQRHWEGYRRVMATGESRYAHGEVLAVPGVTSDGATVSLEFTIVPLTDERGGITGLVAVMRDVTARFRELRELRRKLAETALRSGRQ